MNGWCVADIRLARLTFGAKGLIREERKMIHFLNIFPAEKLLLAT